ncbi:hypothetical protein LTR09_009529 [Extremus antarcticus]|uniref:Uncharacterized protein n=1 Tax=Extremus antarcticus TaxID=702011 RepID=A0AAJ0GBR1_9PEZI|nr:hypothetical protein LTR09_009529 [Extremus antarcticus]
MAAYTIQKDLPPAPASERVLPAPPVSSAYQSDSPDAAPGKHGSIMQAPLSKFSYHPSYHAHPRQQVNDYGPQVRQSRLPIFKTKPPTLATPGTAKWDDYTGELSDSGKAPRVKPSTYETAFKASRQRSPDRPPRSRRSLSPVSVLRDDEINSAPPLMSSRYSPEDISPVSPVSPVSAMSPVSAIYNPEADDEFEFVPEMMPEPLSPNVQRFPQLPQTPASSSQIKRKPVSKAVSTIENIPPRPSSSPEERKSSETGDVHDGFIDGKDVADQRHPNSHFSWTTYAPSVAPGRTSRDTYAHSVAQGRPSIDTMASRQSKWPSRQPSGKEAKKSHFSWSTVNTNMTNRARPDSPEGSPPPSVPTKYAGHPVQSILSRQRPVQRMEKEEWTPPPRKSSRPEGTTTRTTTPKDIPTPTSAISSRPLALPKDKLAPSSRSHSPASTMAGTSSSGKALPPPPSFAGDADRTHLESLLAQAESLTMQRRNVEKGVAELEKIETASPLEVPFATVRDAKKKLEEYRKRLAEVRLEERDVGIAITRARRKEEEDEGYDGETFWVRRVTS